MQLTLKSNHSLSGNTRTLGLDGEHISERIEILIEDTNLFDKWAYLEFTLPDKTSYLTPRLPINDGRISYIVPRSLMKAGYLKLQVSFRDSTEWTWKSFIIILTVFNSINADKEVEEDNPDFITNAQKILDDVEAAVIEVDKKVDKTTKVNNHTLETDVNLIDEDIGLVRITNEDIDSLFS